MHYCRRAIALAFICPVVVSAAGCDDRQPGQPDAGAPGTQAPRVSRLAWSQGAPSADALQRYSYVLFVDGARTTFAGASCAGTTTLADFACSGPLPALPSGRRVLEVSAVDPATGLESPRSATLTVDVGSDGHPTPLLSQKDAPVSVYVETPPSAPTTACAAGTPPACFTVSVIATDIAPVRRLLPLPDGRVLLLFASGAITILPSGTPERPEFSRARDGSSVGVADVAVGPDFQTNRFLYFATTALSAVGQRTVSIVRVRELADRVGEPATVVADISAAADGNPALSIGPDGRLYLAMPGPTDGRTGYAGHVLRFTRDGKAAGHERSGSPILARGHARPTRLAWDAASRLLLASAVSGPEPPLAVVPVAGSIVWPAEPVVVGRTTGVAPDAGSSDLAAAPAGWGSADVATLARIVGIRGFSCSPP